MRRSPHNSPGTVSGSLAPLSPQVNSQYTNGVTGVRPARQRGAAKKFRVVRMGQDDQDRWGSFQFSQTDCIQPFSSSVRTYSSAPEGSRTMAAVGHDRCAGFRRCPHATAGLRDFRAHCQTSCAFASVFASETCPPGLRGGWLPVAERAGWEHPRGVQIQIQSGAEGGDQIGGFECAFLFVQGSVRSGSRSDRFYRSCTRRPHAYRTAPGISCAAPRAHPRAAGLRWDFDTRAVVQLNHNGAFKRVNCPTLCLRRWGSPRAYCALAAVLRASTYCSYS